MKYLYLIREKNGFYKIGVSANIKHRIYNLNGSHPEALAVVCAKLVKDAPTLESNLHQKYKEFRTKTDTDWYALTPEQAIDICMEISGSEEDEYKFKVKDIEGLFETLSINNKELSDDIVIIKSELQEVKNRQIMLNQKQKLIEIIPKKLGKAEHDNTIYLKAVQAIRESNLASTSFLQRKLSIGYSRAARIMDMLEKEGVVSPLDGVSRRIVLQ